MHGFNKDVLEQAVVDSLRAVAPGLDGLDADTPLLGGSAVVDSVGFISLLMALEQRLENHVDLSTSFLEQQGVTEADNPFRSIGALASHLERLLSTRA